MRAWIFVFDKALCYECINRRTKSKGDLFTNSLSEFLENYLEYDSIATFLPTLGLLRSVYNS